MRTCTYARTYIHTYIDTYIIYIHLVSEKYKNSFFQRTSRSSLPQPTSEGKGEKKEKPDKKEYEIRKYLLECEKKTVSGGPSPLALPIGGHRFPWRAIPVEFNRPRGSAY